MNNHSEIAFLKSQNASKDEIIKENEDFIEYMKTELSETKEENEIMMLELNDIKSKYEQASKEASEIKTKFKEEQDELNRLRQEDQDKTIILEDHESLIKKQYKNISELTYEVDSLKKKSAVRVNLQSNADKRISIYQDELNNVESEKKHLEVGMFSEKQRYSLELSEKSAFIDELIRQKEQMEIKFLLQLKSMKSQLIATTTQYFDKEKTLELIIKHQNHQINELEDRLLIDYENFKILNNKILPELLDLNSKDFKVINDDSEIIAKNERIEKLMSGIKEIHKTLVTSNELNKHFSKENNDLKRRLLQQHPQLDKSKLHKSEDGIVKTKKLRSSILAKLISRFEANKKAISNSKMLLNHS